MSNGTIPRVSCPSGGDFYACGEGSRFVGCCGVNPCGLNGCAAGNLVPTSFEASQYGSAALPDQECSAGLFYTCAFTDPPFWGCCASSSACAGSGCPVEDLAGAFLSSNPATADRYLSLNETWQGSQSSSAVASSSSTPSTSTAGIAQSTSATSSPSSSATTAESSALQPRPSNAGAIAGGAVGGIAVLAALVLGILWIRRRHRRLEGDRELHGEEPPSPEQAQMEQAPKEAATASSPQTPYTPPPTYGFAVPQAKHMSYEMPAVEVAGQEMESGQKYHPYRPGRELD